MSAGIHRRGPARWAWAGLTALLSGCMVGPDYVTPRVDTPTQWKEAPLGSADALRLNDWWKTFDDPMLNRLIEEAIRSNLDLQVAENRILQARANRNATIAAGLPSLDARGTAVRRRNYANVPTSGGGSTGGISVGNQTIDIFQSGFDANWELDFFGGVRRAVESAQANLETEEENRKDVLVTLLGEVARNYIELRASQQLLVVTRDNLKSQEDSLDLTRIRRIAGLTSELEEAQTQALVSDTRAQGPVYETDIKLSLHALALLLGKTPNRISHLLEEAQPVPASPQPGLADLPSELLRRRPDIRKAERQLAAASANIGVATAALYPQINLSSFLGMQNTSLASFTPVGRSWSLASTLTMPIFNWGRLQSNIKASEAGFEGAFAVYRNTVLRAFREVEDALVAHAQETQRILSLEEAVNAQKLAVALSWERYRKGLTAYLNVLTAERGLFQAEQELVDSQAKKSAQLVALYKALGGGWQAAEDPSRAHEDLLDRSGDYISDKIIGK